MAIKDITLKQITDPALLKRLAAMRQFHGISDALLFKLAHHVTAFQIPTRWEAVHLIVENGIPIPVIKPPSDEQ